MEGRTAIVTGAGSGIGAAAARLLAERGLHVALVGRTLAPLEQAADEIVAAGGRAFPVQVDLSRPDAPAQVVRAVLDAAGRVDVIVNNAAGFALKPFGEFRVDELDEILRVNVSAPFFLAQEALPALKASPAAAIVNVSSAAAVMYRPRQALYGLAKAALEHLTKQLAAELAPFRIRVNAVRPGPVDTPFHCRAIPDPEAVAQRVAELGRMVPLGRVGRPDEVAWWIAALTEAETAGWVTGAVVPVDGGRVLGPPEAV